MVKILSFLGIVFIALSSLTLFYFQNTEVSNSCQIRILTSNSFYSGVGEDFKSLYSKKYQCDLKFVVVSGANLITNLFLKKPDSFDILLGLDQFQILKMDRNFLWDVSAFKSGEGLVNEKLKPKYFLPYDEAPITFFLRDSSKNEFENLNMFLHYAHANKLSLAVPLKTTSVLGSLFDLWLKNNIADTKHEFKQIKYAKSWSEAFGLFERKIVNGFLSFETSEIFYMNDPKIKKVTIKEGHPNLKEYFAYSSKTNMPMSQKKNFYEFIKSDSVQSLILKKNYMWPTYVKDHEFKALRNLNINKLKLNVMD